MVLQSLFSMLITTSMSLMLVTIGLSIENVICQMNFEVVPAPSTAVNKAILQNSSRINKTTTETTKPSVIARAAKYLPVSDVKYFNERQRPDTYGDWNDTSKRMNIYKPNGNGIPTVRSKEIDDRIDTKEREKGRWTPINEAPQINTRTTARVTREYSGSDLTNDNYLSNARKYVSSNYGPSSSPENNADYVHRNYESENNDGISTEIYSNKYRNYENTDYYSAGQHWPPRSPYYSSTFPSLVSFQPSKLHPHAHTYPVLALKPLFSEATRSDYHSTTLVSILSVLGSNLWQLFKIALGGSLAFIIPLFAIKLFLLPIKIFKFLTFIKILLKLFFVVPFLLRIFLPTVTTAIGGQHHEFSSKMEQVKTLAETRDASADNTTDIWWNHLSNYIGNVDDILRGTTELRACPNKIACEFGSFLTSSIGSHLPEKLMRYLERIASEAENGKKELDEGKIDKENVIGTFVIALGKKWSQEQCSVYTCNVAL